MAILLSTISITAILSSSANAMLIGRLSITEGGTDYQAYYDTETDLTWLANPYLAITSGYDTDGQMNWNDAVNWVQNLSINGVTGWRLPTTTLPDSSCSYQYASYSYGFNCVGSEMGHMYYNVLGGTAGGAGGDFIGVRNSNKNLFSGFNYRTGYFWSSTESDLDTNGALYFSMEDGAQGTFPKDKYELYAWAVYTGDVSSVPVPAAVWLFGSGLITLIGFARRRQ